MQNTEVTEEPEPSFAQSQQSGVQKSPATGAGSIYIALAVSGAAMAGILVLCRKKKAGAC
ncbi:MAG TPA: LPXTG cell wall anchor domain-containing protein [Candidatus Scubalenecus merdavium]|uniref:LPXTG cell wall anchor domain-containing protein n=1 Tax=Candidatus Scybalenecus merdavium TaxID=2840939 RepID=A0A9D1MVP9_9FIRM|nr:LPXTG cell wall anchor domain-containing protein [Candidatus Scubalenecus merdavium]